MAQARVADQPRHGLSAARFFHTFWRDTGVEFTLVEVAAFHLTALVEVDLKLPPCQRPRINPLPLVRVVRFSEKLNDFGLAHSNSDGLHLFFFERWTFKIPDNQSVADRADYDEDARVTKDTEHSAQEGFLFIPHSQAEDRAPSFRACRDT